MAQVLEPLFGLLETKKTICIDNCIFKCHCQVTVALLTFLSVLVSCTQYFGEPIDCIPSGNVPTEVINAYCWIYSTFTLPEKVHGIVGKNFVQPGVSGHVEGEDEVKYHTYYQWVPILLFLQAKLFYVPYFIWQNWEADKLKHLLADENSFISYFNLNKKRKSYTFYAFSFFFCEVLNFINVIAQMYLINVFLGGEFTTYGLEVIKFTLMDPLMRVDPMSRMFPKVSKCAFYKYGPSGAIVNLDALCILPLNVLNEKIYIGIWFWFVLLSIASFFSLLFDCVVLFFPKSRTFFLQARMHEKNTKNLKKVTENCQFGEWFILYQMSKNMSKEKFKTLIKNLVEKISNTNNSEINS